MCCVTLLTGSASVIRNERSLDNEVIDGLHVWLLNGAIFTHCVLILHAKRRKFLHRPLNILRSKSLCVGRNVQVTNDKRRFLAVGRRRIRVGRLWGRAAGSDIRRGEKKESDLLVAPNSDQRRGFPKFLPPNRWKHNFSRKIQISKETFFCRHRGSRSYFPRIESRMRYLNRWIFKLTIARAAFN